jgi:hypothetical protein
MIKTLVRGITWAAFGAVLAGIGGAVVGVIHGAMFSLLDGDWGKVVSHGLYFAGCGMIAGVLVGALAGLLHREDFEFSPDPQKPLAGAAGPQRQQVPIAKGKWEMKSPFPPFPFAR